MLFLLSGLTVLCVASDNAPRRQLSLSFGVHSAANRKKQEDRYSSSCIKSDTPNLFVICDGHYGDKVAEEVSKTLPNYFAEFLAVSQTKEQAFRQAFKKAEETPIEATGGTTVVAGYFGRKNVHIAWVGDSRAVGKTFATRDHTLARNDEWVRVKEARGVIFRLTNSLQEIGPWRINGLVPTRTIKDTPEKEGSNIQFPIRENIFYQLESDKTKHHTLTIDFLPGQVIADPEYIKVGLKENDLFIFATDGLWDVLCNEDALRLVERLMQEKESMDDVAKGLVDEAIKCGSMDNITAVVVSLFSKFAK